MLKGCCTFLINRHRPSPQPFHADAQHEVENRKREEQQQPRAGGCTRQQLANSERGGIPQPPVLSYQLILAKLGFFLPHFYG